MKKNRGRVAPHHKDAWTISEWLEEIDKLKWNVNVDSEKPVYSRVHSWVSRGYLHAELRYQGGLPYWIIFTPPNKENIPVVKRGRKKPSGKTK